MNNSGSIVDIGKPPACPQKNARLTVVGEPDGTEWI